jgi:hypothetical protein
MSNKKAVDIKLREFNMKWVGDNKIIVLIGPRGRGKSTILLDYLYFNQDIPFCTCIAPTDHLNSTFTPHIPSRFIFSQYTPQLLQTFQKRQMDLKQKKQLSRAGICDPVYKDVDCRGILIMDDCLADSKNWKNDPSLKWIFMNGRHADITFILTMQYQVGIPPELRVNIDWVFICRETKKLEKDKLLKYYAGIFPNFDMFNQIFNKCTRDKRCMVIDSLSESDKIEEQVFWYKANIHESFRVCYDEFWAQNDFYLRERMKIPELLGNARKEEDDYYKYVGNKNKIMFNLNMQSDEQSIQDEEYAESPPAYSSFRR